MKLLLILAATSILLYTTFTFAQNVNVKSFENSKNGWSYNMQTAERATVIFHDREGTHVQFFDDFLSNPQFLGERIYKNGELVFDNVKID